MLCTPPSPPDDRPSSSPPTALIPPRRPLHLSSTTSSSIAPFVHPLVHRRRVYALLDRRTQAAVCARHSGLPAPPSVIYDAVPGGRGRASTVPNVDAAATIPLPATSLVNMA
ncbi:hypothetical protein VTO73DRAFT_1546 [Trametes versicolor]